MFRYGKFYLAFVFFLLASCTINVPAPSTSNNNSDIPTNPTAIETPFPKNESGEIVLLLRKRERPFDVVVVRLSNDCLVDKADCRPDGNILATLPENLSQVRNIYWTNDGNKAFFWDDSTTNIYTIDGNQGTVSVFKENVLKVRDDFFVSPNGDSILFEVQKGDYETDLVSININSGEITKFDISEACAKYVSQWIDNNTILFSCEKSEGKGYLVDVKVYAFNTVDHSIQPLEINRDRLQEPVLPIFSPNRNFMAFTDANTIVIRSASTSVENVLNVPAEKFLWSTDSESIAIYSQNKDIFTVHFDGSKLQKLYSLPENEYLEDWMWMPDNKDILLITTDDNGDRKVDILSVVDKTFIPLNLSLLNDYNPISISFRP